MDKKFNNFGLYRQRSGNDNFNTYASLEEETFNTSFKIGLNYCSRVYGLGKCKLLKHRIESTSTALIRMAPRRIDYYHHDDIQQDIGENEAAGIFKKSKSQLAFPIVVVRNKTGVFVTAATIIA